MTRRWSLILLLVLPGSLVVCIGVYGALIDWAALQAAYARFETVSRGSGDMRAVFIAEAHQNIHRINLFADVVWGLLGAILAGIGVLGLCLTERKQ